MVAAIVKSISGGNSLEFTMNLLATKNRRNHSCYRIHNDHPYMLCVVTIILNIIKIKLYRIRWCITESQIKPCKL